MEGIRTSDVSRRAFLKSASAAAAATSAIGYFATAGAAEADLLKIGLVGCGGRGNGALNDCVRSAPNIKITALADLFPDRLESSRKRHNVPKEKCFKGWDAYKKLIATDVDIVLLVTPPHFRPEHLRACVDAGKHVFMEKPVCVDPWGYREVMKADEIAKKKNLSIVAGTCWRHHDRIKATHRKVQDGAIGKIVGGCSWYCGGKLWHQAKAAGWSDMEWQLRDWVNWCWLSGDHIVEQHVHNLDTMHQFMGGPPESAYGFGARHRRVTGDQFDFFSVDFTFPGNIHVQSMCRQISGCSNKVSDLLQGTKGQAIVKQGYKINDLSGNTTWKAEGRAGLGHAYVEEHAVLVKSIRSGQKPAVNDCRNIAEASLMGVMGRVSAYTGKRLSWKDITTMDMRLGPKEYSFSAEAPKAIIPVPGRQG